MSTQFAATRAALKVFDAAVKARIDAWGTVETTEDIDRLVDADKAALAGVQEAFYADTLGINSRGHCALVDIDFMRRCAALGAMTK